MGILDDYKVQLEEDKKNNDFSFPKNRKKILSKH